MARTAHPASFDSATAMVVATSRFLRGLDMPVLGNEMAHYIRPVITGLNRLPKPVRQAIYRVGSGREGLSREVVAHADHEDLARQVVARYPRRRYPAAVVGSTPGSTTHLAAALGVPLLPQTLLLPVRRHGIDPDDPLADLDTVRETGRVMLERNPDMVLHHMSDPNEDRLTLRWFAYFRIKRSRLGDTFERFLRDTLEPGGTIIVSESRHSWPTTQVGDRYVFQFGGVGGLPPQEYLHGSERVAHFLGAHGSSRLRWEPPEPDAERAESEWGFEPQLLDDVQRFADLHGYQVARLVYDEADDLSPFVADLYRWWYRRLGRDTGRLFLESFVLLDPYWVLRAGAVPFWMTFQGVPAFDGAMRYLDRSDPYDRIDLTLVSNGEDSLGVAPVERWRELLARARVVGGFSGVDPKRFPQDLGVFVRYRDALIRSPQHYDLPPPLTLAELREFVREYGDDYAVQVK